MKIVAMLLTYFTVLTAAEVLFGIELSVAEVLTIAAAVFIGEIVNMIIGDDDDVSSA